MPGRHHAGDVLQVPSFIDNVADEKGFAIATEPRLKCNMRIKKNATLLLRATLILYHVARSGWC